MNYSDAQVTHIHPTARCHDIWYNIPWKISSHSGSSYGSARLSGVLAQGGYAAFFPLELACTAASAFFLFLRMNELPSSDSPKYAA
jgi:hypothetical protein